MLHCAASGETSLRTGFPRRKTVIYWGIEKKVKGIYERIFSTNEDGT